MLVRLSIRDIVLIDRLDLEGQAGLMVLTGETGAGKSILLDAFALALGGRGDGGLVRSGQAQGQVTAVFDLPGDHKVRHLAGEAGLAPDGDLILRRVQLADGRTRAFVNDQPASVQLLRQLGQLLVEIHGQHDDRALTDSAAHRRLLDAFAGLTPEAEKLGALHAEWRAMDEKTDAQRKRLEKARADADYLHHAADELRKLAPEEGEETRLSERRQIMMQAEKVVGELAEVLDLLSGTGSPVPTLSSAQRRLDRRAEQAPDLAGPAARALDSALTLLDEAREHLERALRQAEFDPAEQERNEERLFALRAASRKYNTPVDALAALAERFAQDVQALDTGEAELRKLTAEAERLKGRVREAALALSKNRQKAARELDTSVTAELPPLKLERARFITRVQTDPERLMAHGIDQIEFHVQTNPGTEAGPMMKVASGGELSRFLLALKVVLADRGSAPTLVFDEIDTGVGGAVADAIGQRLARLSSKVQVFSVTHAPQVAARASRHFLIQKTEVAGEERVATSVNRLDEKARQEEIARMLSGAEITAEARAAAARLLENAA
jgi:DNA repair protein RecN (Recombination protein N)